MEVTVVNWDQFGEMLYPMYLAVCLVLLFKVAEFVISVWRR